MKVYGLILASAFLGATMNVSIEAQRTDPPIDHAYPAAMHTVQIPSHGALLNGFVYEAAGQGPHPVVLLLHGFPGNEKNLDLAQAIRRAGWDVVYFDYRGSWGTPGSFSFTHAIEDVQAAVAWIRDPTTSANYRANPQSVVLVGHSMGGMIAAYVASQDAGIKAVALISAADMAGRVLPAVQAGQTEEAVGPLGKALAAEGMAPLAGCTPESLALDLLANAARWNVPDLAPRLADRPLLLVSSDDGLAPATNELVGRARKAGNTRVTPVHFTTDHVYSDQRLALEAAVLKFLGELQVH